MKISYRWLARHVDLAGLSPQEVAQDLTLHTAEVEGLEPFAAVLARVVVGHVVQRDKHPDADKLSVTRVDVGTGEALQIVCGAANVAAGQKVAVALPGTEISSELKIKKSKIRGVESAGMICSERELGLGDEHSGIWVLPAEAQVGQPVLGAMQLLAGAGSGTSGEPGPLGGALDWVIELDNKSITHRPDLWGQRGFAAEIAAIRGRKLRPLALRLDAPATGRPWLVRIDHPDCQRYLAVCIDGVMNGRSPDWLRFLLLAVGQRPLDLLVDLSNFVMLDLGQPNHLFDRRRLSPAGIEVRAARSGERMRTLDGVERALEPSDLLICSGDAPVALAGVMGAEPSKVEESTSELLLEVASFAPTTIRRTAQRLALRSDASARFEKSLSPTLPGLAAAHLVSLLRELQPAARVSAPVSDAGSWRDPARSIALRPARVRALLGLEIEDARIEAILSGLGLSVQRGGPHWSVGIPSIRATKDLSIEEDLVEEIGRIVGYDVIPERALQAPLVPAPRDERRELVRALQDRLAGAHAFREAQTYSFLPEELAVKLGAQHEPYVEVINPVSQGWQRVRRSVSASLLGLLEHNLRHVPEVRLFEVGKSYLADRRDARGQPLEVHELALVLAAPREPDARYDSGAYQRLKGVVEDLLANIGRPAARWESAIDAMAQFGLPPIMLSWVHPTRAAFALAERSAGAEAAAGLPTPPAILTSLCELEPGVARDLGVSAEVAVAAVWMDELLSVSERERRYKPLPRFPGVKVDVALAVPEELRAERVAEAIRAAGKDLVAGVELFDLYSGPNAGAGRKSLAWHVELVAVGRTLAEKDTQRFLERLAREAQALGGELRRA